MLAYNAEDRIPTYSLYEALKNIQSQLFQGLERASKEGLIVLNEQNEYR